MGKNSFKILIFTLLSILIVIGLFYSVFNQVYNSNINVISHINDNYYSFHKKDNNYIARLEIPKINLDRYLYSYGSVENNVNYNIEILNDSLKPESEYHHILLAAHNGTGRKAIFKDLDELEINDLIYLYYNNKKYIYKLYNIYDIPKTGYMEVRKEEINKMILITCKTNSIDKQTIYEAYLEY